VLVQISKAIVAITISFALGLGAAWGQAQPSKTQKNWKDRAEYDLYVSITKEPDAKKQLDLLNTWKEKYPSTEYKQERMVLYLNTYRALNQPPGMVETAKEILADNPNDFQALYWISLLTPVLGKTSPDVLDLAEKAGRGLLGGLDAIFAPEKKPASTSEENWKKERAALESLGHRTLGWVAWQRKSFAAAGGELQQAIRLNPNDAEASMWLGTVIVGEKKPERQPEALFAFARAACYAGPGALDEARRKPIDTYLNKAYTTYHGKDPAGLQQLCEVAKANAFLPADFKILSEAEVVEGKHQQLSKENPQLAFWLKLKEALQDTGGGQYFETGMKGALIPPEGQPALKATLISHDPARNPKKLVLGISSPTTPEITLILDEAMTGKADPGTILQFRGVATSFTKEPFMVSFEAEKTSIAGWPAPPPPVRKAPAKKGVVKKKT